MFSDANLHLHSVYLPWLKVLVRLCLNTHLGQTILLEQTTKTDTAFYSINRSNIFCDRPTPNNDVDLRTDNFVYVLTVHNTLYVAAEHVVIN